MKGMVQWLLLLPSEDQLPGLDDLLADLRVDLRIKDRKNQAGSGTSRKKQLNNEAVKDAAHYAWNSILSWSGRPSVDYFLLVNCRPTVPHSWTSLIH